MKRASGFLQKKKKKKKKITVTHETGGIVAFAKFLY